MPHRTAGCGKSSLRPLMADSVEKVALAAASRSDVPAVEVAASHFKLPSGVSLSVLAQV
uniref:BsuBI-PstI family restriction endonuclease (PF06616) n=1 Tax=Pseudomonas aeruginosa TaxID=287 RepID=A0A2L1KIA1_PSEAI|nr:BsuBI-PstI family restriction endonuclease (PF06616) [Pseudomonas aeruginosa]